MNKHEDCQSLLTAGIKKSGEYTIWINGITATAVYCDMVTDGGGWTVFQKRMDGSTNFYRGWDDYKTGFGNKSREFWLGLDAIHELTKNGDISLRIDMTTITGSRYYAKYLTFGVGEESTNYKLHVSGFSGTVVDHLNYHNGRPFTTKDRDNDIRPSSNCARTYKGAWWHGDCFDTNLNSLYSKVAATPYLHIYWRGLPNIQFTEMKIRGRVFSVFSAFSVFLVCIHKWDLISYHTRGLLKTPLLLTTLVETGPSFGVYNQRSLCRPNKESYQINSSTA